MTNLTAFPPLTLPAIYNMTEAFLGCSNLAGDVPYNNWVGAKLWDHAFDSCVKITNVDINFFVTGSTYAWTFQHCTGLTGLILHPNPGTIQMQYIIFPGFTYQNTFRDCINFSITLPDEERLGIGFEFPDATSIAGCFYNTSVLLSTSNIQHFLEITANQASYADIFFDNPRTGAETRKFNTISLSLARCVGAQNMFGPITVTNSMELSILTPDNDNPVNHNIIPYLSLTRASVNLFIRRNDDVASMITYLSIPMKDFIRQFIWRDISITGITIPMQTINDIQSNAGSGIIKFTRCTFSNPTAISKLNDPGRRLTLYYYACTSIQILKDCATANHSVVINPNPD